MDLINELAFILSKNKPAEFNAVLPKNSKTRKLFDLVTTNQVQSDDEASEIIYNSTKADKKYLMLKRNLVQKLSDLVYMQNYEEIDKDNYMNIQFQVEKELLIAEKLLLKNVYHNPTKIIAKVEQTAEQYFFIDIQVAAARKFRSVYALKGVPKKTMEYHEKVKQLVKYQHYYNASRGMWEKLYSKTKFSVAKLKEIITECKESLEKIEEWLKIYNSPFIKLYYYQIKNLLYYQQNNQKNILTNLKKLDLHIKQFPFINTKALQLDLSYYYARYYRDTKQLDLADKSIEKCLKLSDYRAFNKFLIQEINFDIQIKKESYTEAVKILLEVNSAPQFQFLDNYDKSSWAVQEAYLYFIFKSLEIKEQIKNLPIFSKPKSLHTFLERSKKSAKDKYGYNILLLIIRVILYKIHNLREIENEGNNMLVYYHRYLKKLNKSRTAVFFYHLAKTIEQGCNKDQIIDHNKKLIKKLAELNISGFDTTEIIPYEKFFEFWLKLCEQPSK